MLHSQNLAKKQEKIRVYQTLLVGECKLTEKGHRETKRFDINQRRLTAIQRLIFSRNVGMKDDGTLEFYFAAALPYLVKAHPNRLSEVRAWVVKWLPALANNRDDEWFDERISSNWTPHEADELGELLNVTQAEIDRLSLKTIGAVDRPKAVRLAESKEKNRLAEKARRIAAGATPRENSLSQTKPWEALGLNESTYRNRLRRQRIRMSKIRGDHHLEYMPSTKFTHTVSSPVNDNQSVSQMQTQAV